jgi:DNA-binding IclR family transcriptional regulator
MQSKVETVKITCVAIPETFIQMELPPSEFWRLFHRLQPWGAVYETSERCYLISREIVYFARKET